MEANCTYFIDNDCLICEDSHLLTQLIEKYNLEIIQFKKEYFYTPNIILNERQPVNFLAGFIAACRANCPVFLCNPDWGKQEWLQVFDLVKPDIFWGIQNLSCPNTSSAIPNIQLTRSNPQYIMIPTGGSSGKIKFSVHTWDTLTASVEGFKEYFGVDRINSFCLLPLYHVSGLMQFMRCFITGGKLVVLSLKSLESDYDDYLYNLTNKYINNLNFFISLVPTQLERLLQKLDLTKWLGKFETVLLGGAPAWDELLQKARFHHIRLAPTYGMTETASQIATMKPKDFLQGKIGCGQILPHAKVKICDDNGKDLPANSMGSINIKAKSLTLGYYPLNSKIKTDLQIDDLAILDEEGYLDIVGRNSHKIITGGENVYPLEVEESIRATGIIADICVIGLADKYWGQVVTAIYVKKSDIPVMNHQYCQINGLQEIDESQITSVKNLLKEKLSNYKIPKIWIQVNSLPRNSQGKINRQKLYEIAEKLPLSKSR